jgi:hypothetical protein
MVLLFISPLLEPLFTLDAFLLLTDAILWTITNCAQQTLSPLSRTVYRLNPAIGLRARHESDKQQRPTRHPR